MRRQNWVVCALRSPVKGGQGRSFQKGKLKREKKKFRALRLTFRHLGSLLNDYCRWRNVSGAPVKQ